MPSPFFVDAQNDYGQPLAGLGNMIGEAAKQKKALALQQQQKDNLMKAMQSGNTDMIMRASMDAPELAEEIRAGYEFAEGGNMKEVAERNMQKLHRTVAMTPDDQIPQLIMDTYEQKTSQGIPTPVTGAALEILRDESIPMEERIKMIKDRNMELYSAGFPEDYGVFADNTGIGTGGGKWQKGESVQVKDGNKNNWDITTMVNPNGQTKEMRTPLGHPGIKTEEIDYSFNPEGAEILNSSTGEAPSDRLFRDARLLAIGAAIRAGENFNDQIQNTDETIRNLNDAYDAVEAGANTGWVDDWFPSMTAATISLKNAQNRLGLNVIGSVTFGALSEGELKLALDTALPTSMEEPALKAWIKERIEAKQKLRDYFARSARELTGGTMTIADYLAKEEELRASKNIELTEEEIMAMESGNYRMGGKQAPLVWGSPPLRGNQPTGNSALAPSNVPQARNFQRTTPQR